MQYYMQNVRMMRLVILSLDQEYICNNAVQMEKEKENNYCTYEKGAHM